MKNKKTNKTMHKVFSVIALATLFAGTAGMISSAYAAEEVPATVKVTIEKYVGGSEATALSANSSDFQMSATWNAENIGAGTGQYSLSAGGSYQAVTADMTSGADYSTSEIVDATVGATCDAGAPFALVGYTSGDTLGEAQAATPSLTSPAFTGLTNDKFVIVWNKDCSLPASVQVHISKNVNGSQANATSASSSTFTMNATWNAANIGTGTGQYTLNSTDATPYQTSTVNLDSGASYSTNEVTDDAVTGANCAANKPFALQGYTTGDTYAQAASATPTLVAPSFTNLMHDKSVIVWNQSCVNGTTSTSTGGTIGGDVTGGQATGTLAVTSIDTVDSSATADGTFANGWKYVFHITAPTNEQHLSMKFSDWMNTTSSSTIPAANNIRISSSQADNSGATVLITAADTYSSPALNLTTDLDPATPGRQVDVTVEVSVPTNTVNGSYTTNYGVKTL